MARRRRDDKSFMLVGFGANALEHAARLMYFVFD
jgi:hypothetical protein